MGKELFETTVNNRKEYNPADEERALKIIRYGFEYYMEWTPEQIWVNIDEEILKKLKLDNWDSGDILLLLIVLFLLLEGDNLELAIALGLVLIMGLGDDKEQKPDPYGA